MTESGFIKANSGNLPYVDVFMVATYLSSCEKCVGAELKEVKNSRAGRETYGDDAIGYVQIQRSQTTCLVKARNTPEHKVRNKCYNLTLTVEESSGKIVGAECLDCAAFLGGCKHAIVLLMWIHRRSEDPAPTSVACYWRKSKLSKVGSEIKFIKAKSLVSNSGSGNASTSNQVNSKIPGSFLSSVVTEGMKVGAHIQLLNHYKPVQLNEHICLNTLSFNFAKHGGGDAADFFEFCGRHMGHELCLWAEKETRIQSEVSLWHKLRFGRITASKIYEAARCKTFNGSLVEAIFDAKIADTTHMKRRRDLEPQVLKVVEEIVGKSFKKSVLFCGRTYRL